MLTAGEFGHPEDNGSLGFADSEIARLPDGRLRIYMYVHQGIASVVSSDGVHWTLEPGNRCSQTCGQIAAVPLASGGWRIFGGGGGDIRSATTEDGLSWTDDPGFRVSNSGFSGAADESLSGPRVVAVPGGGWRMYFHKGAHDWFPGSSLPAPRVLSAFSSDLLNWVPDAGVRASGVQHPNVVAVPGGGYQMFGHSGFEVVTATSTDGLTWPARFTPTGLQGGDPVPLRMPDGTLRLYYNDSDAVDPNPQGGGLYWAQLETATWDVTFQGEFITVHVTGSGGPVTVRLTDRGRSQDRPTQGLPHTAQPPFTVSLTVPGTLPYQPLIEVSDGTVNRYFDPHDLPSPPGGPGPAGCGPTLTFDGGPHPGELCPARDATVCVMSSTITYTVSGGVGGTDQVQVVMTVIPADSGRSRVSAGKLSDGQTYGVVETVAGQVTAHGRSGFFTRGNDHGTIDAVLDDEAHITGDWRCSPS